MASTVTHVKAAQRSNDCACLIANGFSPRRLVLTRLAVIGKGFWPRCRGAKKLSADDPTLMQQVRFLAFVCLECRTCKVRGSARP